MWDQFKIFWDIERKKTFKLCHQIVDFLMIIIWVLRRQVAVYIP